MPLDLIATLIVGSAAALFTWLFYRARRRPMPRRLLPIVVGTAMIGYTIWSEYSWGWRTAESLPEGVEVIEMLPERGLWRPWTFLHPSVGRMIAVDRGSARRNSTFPEMVMVDLVLLERWLPARHAIRLIDCADERVADVTNPAAFAEGGLPPADAWTPMRRDGPLFRAACTAPPGG